MMIKLQYTARLRSSAPLLFESPSPAGEVHLLPKHSLYLYVRKAWSNLSYTQSYTTFRIQILRAVHTGA